VFCITVSNTAGTTRLVEAADEGITRTIEAIAPLLPEHIFHIGLHLAGRIDDLLLSCSGIHRSNLLFHEFLSDSLSRPSLS